MNKEKNSIILQTSFFFQFYTNIFEYLNDTQDFLGKRKEKNDSI